MCSTIYVFRRRLAPPAREYMQMPSRRGGFSRPCPFLLFSFSILLFSPPLALPSRRYCFYPFFLRWLRLSHLSQRDINRRIMPRSCSPRDNYACQLSEMRLPNHGETREERANRVKCSRSRWIVKRINFFALTTSARLVSTREPPLEFYVAFTRSSPVLSVSPDINAHTNGRTYEAPLNI